MYDAPNATGAMEYDFINNEKSVPALVLRRIYAPRHDEVGTDNAAVENQPRSATRNRRTDNSWRCVTLALACRLSIGQHTANVLQIKIKSAQKATHSARASACMVFHLLDCWHRLWCDTRTRKVSLKLITKQVPKRTNIVGRSLVNLFPLKAGTQKQSSCEVIHSVVNTCSGSSSSPRVTGGARKSTPLHRQ